MAGKKGFSARAMFTELKTPGSYYLTGAVKEHEQDHTLVLFSAGDDCTDWLSIPENLIEGYERHGTLKCNDHSHPYVTLKLREPSTPEAGVFARATTLSTTIERTMLRTTAGGSATDCTWDTLTKRWVDPWGRPCIPR